MDIEKLKVKIIPPDEMQDARPQHATHTRRTRAHNAPTRARMHGDAHADAQTHADDAENKRRQLRLTDFY